MTACRFKICTACGKRHRGKPERCKACGSRSFKFSDWYIRFYYRGQRVEEKVPGGKALAERVLLVRKTEMAEGRYNLHRKRMTFERFVLDEWWEVYAQKLSESTRRDYHNRIHQHLLDRFGHIELDRITRRDIEDFLAELSLSPGSVAKWRSLLQTIFSRAVERNRLVDNPVKGLPWRRIDNRRVRFLTEDEYKRLITACGDNENLKAAIALAVGTGLRKAALFGLKWEHLDFDNRIITLPAALNKSKKRHTVPMIDSVYDALNSLPRSMFSNYVLTKKRTATGYRDMRTAFERAAREAKLIDFRWHDLRHTFASWLVMSGADLYTVSVLMGVGMEIVKRYAHLSPEHMSKQAQKLNRIFSSEGLKKAKEE